MTLISGTYTDETLRGTSMDDSLNGGAGSDTLLGDAGNDFLYGGEEETYLNEIIIQEGYWEEGEETESEIWVVDLESEEGGYWETVYEPGAPIWVPPIFDYEEEIALDRSDSLLGGLGNDTLQGSRGGFFLPIDSADQSAHAPDTLAGGAGDDLYLVYNVNKEDLLWGFFFGDTIYENAGEGIDTIRLYANPSPEDDFIYIDANLYILPENVENIELYDDARDVLGNESANLLIGNDQDNYLLGGREDVESGDDTLIGGGGNDFLFGGDGNDRASFSGNFQNYQITELEEGSFSVRDLRSNSPDGTDELLQIEVLQFQDRAISIEEVLTGFKTLAGGIGNDNLVANREGQYLDGLAGNDTLNAGSFNGVTLSGGSGNDSYLISNYTTEVLESASGGTDTVRLSTTTGQPYTLPDQVENLELVGEATDALGNALPNRLTGNSKGNFLDGRDGNDTMTGGAGNDYYVVASAGDLVVEAANGGNDTVRALASYTLPAQVEALALWDTATNGTGNSQNNDIDGNAVANLLLGLGGNDDLFGAGANDTVRGGTGNDFLDGGLGNDLVEGDEGNDNLIGKEDNDTLRGGAGRDTLDGWAGNDLLEGGDDIDNLLGKEGNDTLDGGAGADVMLGGAGNDLYIIDDVNDQVVEIGNQGTDTLLIGGDSITTTDADWDGTNSIEVFRTGNGKNSVVLGAKAQASGLNRTLGGSGNDSLNASAFTHGIALEGAAGNDLLRSGSGNDTLLGGAGNDTLAAGRGNDSVMGGEGNDSLVIDWSAHTGAKISHKVVKTANSFKGSITAKNSAGAVLSQVSLDSIESIQLNGKAWSPEPPKPGVLVSRTSTAAFTTEQGGRVEYSVALQAAPKENVSVAFSSSDATEGKVNTPTLTFTPKNWDKPQSLVIQGVDDFLDDKDVAYTINGKVVTEDLTYNRITVSSINIINKDDTEDMPLLFPDGKNNNGVDYIQGKNGNDTIYGGQSQDELRGGRGDDELYGEQDNDRLLGELGNDVLYGGYGGDRLDGGEGADSLFGEQGVDTLLGGAGNDYLSGGELNDSMSGGAGNDTYFVDSAGDQINDQGLATDVDTVLVLQAISYTLPANVENAAINATGNANLTGNALNNGLTGNDAKNVLDGGTGNDKLDGGGGADSLVGGAGNDAMIGGVGNDTMRGGAGVDLADFAAAGVDLRVDLSTGRVTGEGADLLFDIENILAGEGEDTLLGNASGNDLDGGAGTDSLSGGAGNDTLAGCFFGANGGRAEIDTLAGGVGNDIFQLGWASGRFYDDGNTRNAGRADYVVITDFTVGQDKLQLDGARANYYLGASGVSGVAGTGLWAEQGATDELIAIIRSANTTALNTANTVNTALFV